ncbi:hypothetical protein [Clostridium beijerinckii]|uniref:hypothetical protein n=1 Tax=Clostridium beijerinckii TaxID=1520 RepID=UPI0022E1EAD8|nr:hypothetical protein [Clostridium beijerinckii]
MPKYKQPIYAEITRVYDEKLKEYHLLRNDTKIIFGNDNKLLGTVIMSNPGSFDFKYDPNWTGFINGEGSDNIFKSKVGRPDSTMINIIKAIETAYAEKGSAVPDGYVRIYNISSVRCAQGKKALEVHNRVREILYENESDISILKDPTIYDEALFKNLCNESAFVIMGFIKGFLNNEAEMLIQNIDKYNKGKKIAAYSNNNRILYHPACWIRLNKSKPFRDIVDSLKEIV